MMILYEFLNKITNEGYVGITHRPIEDRKYEHLYELRKGKHHNIRFQNAYNKYGEKSFEHIVRKTFDNLDSLNKAEIEVLEKEKDRLYNVAPGGNSGYHNFEARKKISKCQLKSVVGMCIDTGEIRKYSSVTETEKDGFDYKNIGGACKLSRYNSKNRSNNKLSAQGWVWMYQKDFDLEEMKRRRHNASRSKIRLERPIAGKHLRTGKVVIFKSGEDCRRELGIKQPGFACEFKTSKTRGGYVWVYMNESGWEFLLEERYLQLKNRKSLKGTLKKMSTVIGMSVDTGEIKEYSSADELKLDGFDIKGVNKAINESVTYSLIGTPYVRISYKNYAWCKKSENSILILQDKIIRIKNKKVK
jgi:hypothetical protein